jgi:hypothetical protein
LYAPIGNGVTIKAGHFYTIIGNEAVTSPDNFFYSRHIRGGAPAGLQTSDKRR